MKKVFLFLEKHAILIVSLIVLSIVALNIFTYMKTKKVETEEIMQEKKDSIGEEYRTDSSDSLTREDTIMAMVTAFAIQESGCNPKAVSACGNYVGYLQISKVCVREANRILGENLYTYDDRYDEVCSYGIFKTLQEYHNPTLDIDKAITIWNKNCPQWYRKNVKKNYITLIES